MASLSADGLFEGTARPNKNAPKMVCTPATSVKKAEQKIAIKVKAKTVFWHVCLYAKKVRGAERLHGFREKVV